MIAHHCVLDLGSVFHKRMPVFVYVWKQKSTTSFVAGTCQQSTTDNYLTIFSDRHWVALRLHCFVV